MSIEALAAPIESGWVGCLGATVRPEFRAEVLVPAVADPILGSPACAVPGCVRSSRYGGLCPAHLGRWRKAGCPDRQAWAAAADPEVMSYRPLQSCLVPDCGFGQHRYRLCYRHSHVWDKAGRPAVDQWTPQVAGAPAVVCAIPGCALWAELDAGWCHSHHRRWRLRGRPPAAEFLAYCASYGEDRFDLRALRPQVRLEIQYALQCRVDANRTRTTPRSIKPLLDHLSATGAESLLERPLDDWLAGLPAAAALHTPRAFLAYAIECLLDLRDGTGWDSEYQRDVWRLRRLGVSGHDGARLDFTAVQPVWLRELVKRWCRWRMSCGVGLGQLRRDRIALVRLSWLTPGLASSPDPNVLGRAALEAYLARLAVEIPHPKTRSTDIGCVTGFLHAVRQHRWASLPAEGCPTPSRRHPRTRPPSPAATRRNRPAAHHHADRRPRRRLPLMALRPARPARPTPPADRDIGAIGVGTSPDRARVRRLAAPTPHTRTRTHSRTRRQTRQLRNQIALLHGQLRVNRIATTHITDTVHDANTQLTRPNSRSRPR